MQPIPEQNERNEKFYRLFTDPKKSMSAAEIALAHFNETGERLTRQRVLQIIKKVSEKKGNY